MGMTGKSKKFKMEVRAKTLTTAHTVAGQSRSGMLVSEAIALTEKVRVKRKSKRVAQKAARRRNRK